MTTTARQFTLPLPLPVSSDRADFLEDASNAEALAWLDEPGRWPGRRIALFGQRVDLYRLAAYDTQTGKTHPLAWNQASADASQILHVDKKNKRILLARQIDDGDTERRFSYQVDWVDVATGKVIETVQRTNPIRS